MASRNTDITNFAYWLGRCDQCEERLLPIYGARTAVGPIGISEIASTTRQDALRFEAMKYQITPQLAFKCGLIWLASQIARKIMPSTATMS
jgi:hypothetical protein